MLSQLGLRHMTRVKRSKTLGVACEACFVPVMQKIQINRLFTLIRIYHSLFSGSLRSLLSAWHRSLQIRKQAAQNRLRKLRPRACSACFVPVLQKMQITPLFYVEPYFCTLSPENANQQTFSVEPDICLDTYFCDWSRKSFCIRSLGGTFSE